MEKYKNTKLDSNSISRILIMIFSAFMGLCVTFVMVCVYDPTQNTLVALSSVSMDIVCMIILLVLICSFAFESYISNRTTRIFATLLVATMWALFTDFLNWAFDGELVFWHMTYWFTVGSLCMGSILACIFTLYLYSYMDEMHKLGRMHVHARVCAILNILSFVFTFALAISGTAFKFVDGHYETGIWYDLITVIPILTLLYLTAYVIRHVRKVGIHDVVAATGYIIFMITGALIEAENGIGTTYVAVAIADIFIFVMLQNEIISKEKQTAQEWMAKSKTDELTTFFNRYAYEDDVTALENSTLADDFVYVSVDVNSLKNVNDSFGHSAGDELIVGASQCLQECLGQYGKLYRIGGDEFIALINVDSSKLDEIKQNIEERTQKWNGELVNSLTLSCGYVSKSEDPKLSIRQMAVLADRRMYKAKNEYYRRTGIERRRK